MSVTRKQNVIILDADNDTVPEGIKICGIKYMPGTSAQLRAGTTSSGTVLWEAIRTTEIFEEVEINAKSGVYVDLAGSGAKLYLYLE